MRSPRFAVLALALALSGCLSDQPMKLPMSYAPRALDDGWALSTPEAEGLDPTAVRDVYEAFFSDDAYPTVRSLLIVRNGKLVAEGYARESWGPDDLQSVKSVSKSIISLLVGAARNRGLLTDLDAPLLGLLPPTYRGAADITLRDALTMRTGIAWDNDRDNRRWVVDEVPDSVAVVLAQPRPWRPGTLFDYHDGNVHLVGAALEQATGQPLHDFARDALYAPLGIEASRWEAHRDGRAYAAFGAWLRPRDMARLGQLVLQGGVWEGERLVDPDYLSEGTRGADARRHGYGFYWWLRPDFDAFTASGHGGQAIWVDPARDLVVVLTADPYTVLGQTHIDLPSFERLIYPLLVTTPTASQPGH